MQHSERHNPHLNILPLCLLFLPGSLRLAGRAVKPPIPANADRLTLASDRLDLHPSSRLDD
ncbi:hypothetical protein EST62_12600 [Chlorobaculum sp. 24CR]|uniref:hypothetical protein n=1 Tax=Chlorobaculum sp. 24CR TaxID=2508878 RepID=UPI00100BEF7A|nr:hypothetical protein [Chlorobaculum sp. 24CR]RXK80676.1 hypothetical protein EST62_12600 [Chlorobaculum sp. 24CR]